MSAPARLHVIIPAFCEQATIGAVLTRLRDAVRTPLRVSVVCDAADDPTFAAVDAVRARLPYAITDVVNAFGTGALNAIQTGLRQTQADEAALVVMADGCDELEIVDGMWRRLLAGYDVVCGSRYMPGGQQLGGWWLKKLLSRTAGLSYHRFTGIGTHDITNSFKLYSFRALSAIAIESVAGFEIGMELTIKAHRRGLSVTELPTTWTDRTARASRFRFRRWLPHYLRWYLRGLWPAAVSRRVRPARPEEAAPP